WGLFAGGEPSVAFRTQLSSFRATLPVSCGQLAGQRIATLILGWGLVWLPLLGLSFFHTPEMTSIPVESPVAMQAKLASFAALGAYVAVGALPLFLWGRFEGFPNFLLAGVGTWAWIWLLGDVLFLEPGTEPGWRWLVLGGLLMGKAAVTAWGLGRAWRAGHITWKFPVVLVTGWVAVTGGLVFGLPLWRMEGAWPALIVVLVMPLGRLAWCPEAVAGNRHR
ncbi:MAG TPA: hypothetical protein VNT26_07715, partial [Candidatus Sulfotelmatobacter sp.]|nr:hypothetical protein [Candidatus Sulfotelmatobacter sp.]